MAQAIIFDFDGVILDSLPIREVGFREIFKEYSGEKLEHFIAWHHYNGGISRFYKIRYFYERYLGKSISEEEVSILATSFSSIMKEALVDSKYLIGETLEFIKKAHREIPLFIASGSEEKELRMLCDAHRLSGYFVDIKGSPVPKDKNVEFLLEQYGLKNTDTVLIGDSINDLEAADANNIGFYGYNNPSLKKLGKGYIDSFSAYEVLKL